MAYVIGETAKALKYLHDSDFIHRYDCKGVDLS